MADERDHIDFIFYNGESSPLSWVLNAQDAWLVGTPLAAGGEALVDESKQLSYLDKYSHSANSPWPSDNRAVMTVFGTTDNLA
jgi:hypothetical protein